MSTPIRSIGRYELVEKIATGGMAELYRARVPGLSGFLKTVAIKRILPELSQDSRFREMFLHEGRIMGALSHVNLVQIFELGEADGELYLCLEFVLGQDLYGVLQKYEKIGRHLPVPLAAWITREILRGLGHIHNAVDDAGNALGIVHRDLTPSNVLLSLNGEVKLADFGIARSEAMQVRTQRGRIKGKLRYLSPEQARGEAATQLTDIYAAGLVLFEMLSSTPYIDDGRDMDVLRNAAKPTWRPPQRSGQDLPPDLVALVQRALRPLPEERFATAAAFANSLSQFLHTCTTSQGSREELAELIKDFDKAPNLSADPSLQPATRADLSADIQTSLTLPGKDSTIEFPRTSTVSLSGMPSTGLSTKRIAALVLIGTCTVLGIYWCGAPASDTTPGTNAVVLAQYDANFCDVCSADSLDARSAVDFIAAQVPEDASATAAPQKRVHQTVNDNKPRRLRAERKSKEATAKASNERRQQLQQNLDLRFKRGVAEMRQKGVRRGDDSVLDSLTFRVRRQLRRNQLDDAQKSIGEFETMLANVRIDRAFVEKKILRLQDRVAKKGLEDSYQTERRTILEHALAGRYDVANAHLNKLFERLGK